MFVPASNNTNKTQHQNGPRTWVPKATTKSTKSKLAKSRNAPQQNSKIIKAKNSKLKVRNEDKELEDWSRQNPDGSWNLEKIIDSRVRNGILEYYIKWIGWSEECNTWEPVDNLTGCNSAIRKFEQSRRQGNSKTSSA